MQEFEWKINHGMTRQKCQKRFLTFVKQLSTFVFHLKAPCLTIKMYRQSPFLFFEAHLILNHVIMKYNESFVIINSSLSRRYHRACILYLGHPLR